MISINSLKNKGSFVSDRYSGSCIASCTDLCETALKIILNPLVSPYLSFQVEVLSTLINTEKSQSPISWFQSLRSASNNRRRSPETVTMRD
jgi:hypothetical protein